MSDTAERYRKVAAQFTQRVQQVPDGAWDNAAPCEGWVARDVVRHLVEWIPGFVFNNWGIEQPVIPSVDDDPVGAWLAVDRAIQAGLDDPAVAAHQSDSPAGRKSFEEAIAMFCTTDVLVHTWDLARATGQDERLHPDAVRGLADSMAPMDEAMRNSGHYGPRVEVPDDADDQTKLIAFTGRQP
ncbi:MAG: hypothetical protein JWN99_2495 [Ilumatobacteraceae bacterium]|nr:hypothetical protein [Ilumatobacteraceae bacterium]